jgi:hypothetical protein
LVWVETFSRLSDFPVNDVDAAEDDTGVSSFNAVGGIFGPSMPNCTSDS